jgi:putative DNA methylase
VPEEQSVSLARAEASKFLERLCKYPGSPQAIAEAKQHIFDAHADRLSLDSGKPVTAADILEGRSPSPRILDMFAGGGSIPLEALRLGCEVDAVELNPVAHIIELCTVTFPQLFGAKLADDVEAWGRLVLDRVRTAVADLFARVALPGDGSTKPLNLTVQADQDAEQSLSVVAYYWTRTAPCSNPACTGTVPLYRQTWLRKRPSGFVALRPHPDFERKRVRFEVVTAQTEGTLGFDPAEGSRGTATACPFCQSVVDAKYVRTYGDTHGFGQQLMCVIALNPHGSGKLYIADESLAEGEHERQQAAEERATLLEAELGGTSLDEEIPPTGNAGLATGKSYLYGIKTFRQAFTPRQRCVLLATAKEIRRAHEEMLSQAMEPERAKAVTTYLGLWLSRLTERFNTLARWHNSGEKVEGLTSMKRFAMTWDFPEVNVFGGASGDAWGHLGYITAVIRQEGHITNPATCVRCSATELPYPDQTFDAVITDPPYYDNESYSELSDVCYVWMRSAIGFLYPEHFSSRLTPKKKECVAAAYRQGGTQTAARQFYESCLAQSLAEAHRVTKPGGILVMIYAHKTTAGWGTLVEAIRCAGFEVAEAWPLETETKARVAHQEDAALMSNIFIAARKRERARLGSYEDEVQPELRTIVRERVETLWDLGVSGADLVIAAVGAGLRAYTRFERTEYANGEEVPPDRFLREVEGVVLETLLEKIFGVPGAGMSVVDGPSSFYVLWRYTYKTAPLDAGEAIVFTYSQRVELDGPGGLSTGSRALVEKKKGVYRLLDFTERGANEKLGLPDDGQRAPLIDVLHRALYLMEYQPGALSAFLAEANPDRESLRLLANVLARPGLKGGDGGGDRTVVTTQREQTALNKLVANWRTLVNSRAATPQERAGQGRLL